MRRDARLRRERLIAAAIELFTEEGFDVPLERIAERAAVGRATLYRNFPDREALGRAVVEARLADLEATIDKLGEREDAFFLALHALAALTLAASGLEKVAAIDERAPSITERFRTRVEELMAEPLARAQGAGLVRQDFELGDVHIAALMIAAGALDGRGGDRSASLRRAERLLVRGLSR